MECLEVPDKLRPAPEAMLASASGLPKPQSLARSLACFLYCSRLGRTGSSLSGMNPPAQRNGPGQGCFGFNLKSFRSMASPINL